MAAQTKTAQLRELGWNISPVPFLVPEGLVVFPDGHKAAGYFTTRGAREWLVNPPEDHPVVPRQIHGRNPAIRWVYEHGTAPRLDPSLSGVQSLASAAATSDTVTMGEDEATLAPARPDAELITLWQEAMSREKAVEAARGDNSNPWTEREAHNRVMARLSGHYREWKRLLPLVFEQQATTHEGLCAMAEVLRTLYDDGRGLRAKAVCSLVGDLLKVLAAQKRESRA